MITSASVKKIPPAGREERFDTAAWAEKFRQAHGRPPRVLHIGNVANNGYNNAKLLNEAGIQCDVLCYSYYHIMGCPEWEDADFHGGIDDEFSPSWDKVDLNGFRRPEWFVQGPLTLCLNYLNARNAGRFEAVLWRNLLDLKLHSRVVRARRWLRGKADYLQARKSAYLDAWKQKCFHDSRWPLYQTGTALALVFFSLAWLLFASFMLFLYTANWMLRKIRFFRRRMAGPKRSPDFDSRVRELMVRFGELFPERSGNISADDFETYWYLFPRWSELLKYYDLVQGNATDTVYPMLTGFRPYVAYEHGTIRDIPFQEDSVGRLCALSYRMADAVIITNPDCVEAARTLKLENYRYVPHVLDKKYYNETGLYESAGPVPVSGPFVFCPARHDWDVKGTQHAIRGFARFHAEHPEFKLVMSRWGKDVERSRQLIKELGIEPAVVLIDPLKICDLIRVSRQAFALIDQFVLFFGGIAPTALAVGTPLVAHIDFSKCAWCFDTPPPYFEASCAEDVYRALQQVRHLNIDEYRSKGRAWVQRNYNYRDVVSRHGEIYSSLLSGAGKEDAVR